MTGYQELPIDAIRESKYNPRRHFDQKKLDELTSSVRQKGVLVPLIARPSNGHYELAAGHRRLRAAIAAGLGQVPVIVREMDEEAFLEVLTIENLQREDVHPLEEAEGFERLLKLKGYTLDLLAEKIGKSDSYITKRRQLAKLIEPLKQAFLEDRIQIAHAVQLARLEPKDQDEAFKGKLFRDETDWDGKKNVKVADITISPSELKAWIAGPCGICGEYQDGKGHATDAGLRCSSCCAIHGAQATLEWTGEPVTVSGKQEALF